MNWAADVLAWFTAPFDSWTAHQLDVLRSVAIAIGSGLIPVFGLVVTVYARLIRRDTKATRQNTVTEDWDGGVLVATGVAETARHAVQKAQQAVDSVRATGEVTRQEVSDLAGWVKGGPTGRRRLPTTEIPQPSAYTGEVDYES
jgi:hypothetical protein